uniref:Uncharacterized protein n=1 Tax=Astyanax mexicanus TaxID=7994 RepID=A0A3B1INR3_ASTMX
MDLFEFDFFRDWELEQQFPYPMCWTLPSRLTTSPVSRNPGALRT